MGSPSLDHSRAGWREIKTEQEDSARPQPAWPISARRTFPAQMVSTAGLFKAGLSLGAFVLCFGWSSRNCVIFPSDSNVNICRLVVGFLSYPLTGL